MREAEFTKSLSVALSEDVYQKIKQITDDEKISITRWVRQAINQALEGDAVEEEQAMGNDTIIENKAEFETTATTFLDKLFKPVLERNLGDIEIRTFPYGQWQEQYFCQTT